MITKPAGSILKIIRYPIKGFRGEELSEVDLIQNQGLPHDRRWAIRNGSLPPTNTLQDWEPCQAFIRMTQHEELPTYAIERSASALYLAHPNGQKIEIGHNNDHQSVLGAWFQHQDMALTHSNNKTAYWDHQDAHLSIINAATVRAISNTAGVDLDPQRFRGNLLIDTFEPWSEFNLVGRRITIGDAVLEVLRPIDRCKATSINPQTGTADLNIPHLLSRHYGHIFCGVYARVITSGKIRITDTIDDVSLAPTAITDGIKPSTAPPAEHWPRPMRVIKRVSESHHVDSFWLEDPFAAIIATTPPAGYLRLHTDDEKGPLTRSYTISQHSECGRFLRLSIKKEQGNARFSPWIHSNVHKGDTILVSGPFVDPSLMWRPQLAPQKDIVILTAGIGITMASSLVSTLKRANYRAHVSVVHSIPYEKEGALWQEVLDDLEHMHNTSACLFITQGPTGVESLNKQYGRVNLSKIMKKIALDHVQVFLCGPQSFHLAMHKTLLEIGVNDGDIHEDVFTSPTVLPETTKRQASLTTPMPIRFIHASGEESAFMWQPQHETLLNTAEENGVSITANCRSGACRACMYPIEGEVENLISPISPAPKQWAYLCCAAPLSPLKIKEKRLQ